MPRQRRALAQLGFDGFTEILHEMPAVGDLHRVRGALGHSGGVGFRAIPRHDRHLRMGPEPGRNSLGGAVLEQIHRATPVQIDHDRAIRMPFPFGPIVDTNGTRP